MDSGGKCFWVGARADQLFVGQFEQELQLSGGRVARRHPVDPTVAKEFANDFPQPAKLWTIEDLGGWKTVDGTLFKKETGSIAVIYDKATS